MLRHALVLIAVGLLSAFAHAEVLELEGTVKAVDAAARSLTVTRTTPNGEKTLRLEVAKKAGDLTGVKTGDAISFSYDPDLEIVTKLSGTETPAAIASSSRTSDSTEAFPLFNGENLSGWRFIGDEKERDTTWVVGNKLLVCSGKEGAALLTDVKYRDFVLTLEWRIPEGVTPTQDGLGLVFRCPSPSEIGTHAVRFHLNDRPNVALWTLGASSKPKVSKGRLEQSFQSPLILSKNTARKPLGAWNNLRISSIGDKVSVTQNGEDAIEVSGVDSTAGHIGFTPTGTRIELRNIRLQTK